jgi:transcriptional regulator with XRE-family HTH domain
MNFNDYYRQKMADPTFREATDHLQMQLDMGSAILSARIARGWSQRELAERVGTRQANISRIECGVANPTLDLISRILRVLEISVTFAGPTPPPTEEPEGYALPLELREHAVHEKRRKVK